jgi:lipoyl(octanoyl) transferase
VTSTIPAADEIIEWAVSPGRVPYPEAMAAMAARAVAIREGRASELVWLLEHPPLYTAGTSAVDAELLDAVTFPVYRSNRGGRFTYHGPGQRIAYVMLDLRRRESDVRRLVRMLESWVIDALAAFNVKGERHPDRIGVWVRRGDDDNAGEEKIAAIGLRVSRSITTHGISLNVDPDLSHYQGIVPCGISEHGVTSLAALGHPATMHEVDKALRASFEKMIAPLRSVAFEGHAPAATV